MGRILRPEQYPALADVQESPRRAPRVAAEGGRVAAVEGGGPRRAPPRHGAIRPLLLLLPQRAEQRNVGADDGAEHGAYTSHSQPTLS